MPKSQEAQGQRQPPNRKELFIMKRFITSLLIVLMAWSPFQMAQASMIGTGQIVANQAQSDRNTVLSFVERQEVAGQLQTLGTDAASAKDRVNAMTDEEVGALAQRIDSMPAGGLHGAGSLIVIAIVIGVIWWAAGRPGMTGR
jgi:hypothetical protein